MDVTFTLCFVGQGSTDSTRKGPAFDHTSMDVVGHYVHVNLDKATGKQTELGNKEYKNCKKNIYI